MRIGEVTVELSYDEQLDTFVGAVVEGIRPGDAIEIQGRSIDELRTDCEESLAFYRRTLEKGAQASG